MPGLNVKTSLFPFRMKLRHREPVRLEFAISNNSDKPKIVSFELELPRQLGFDKSGLKRVDRKRLTNKLMQGESRNFSYEIFPSKVVETGNYVFSLNVNDHFNDFSHLLETKEERVSIKIED